MGLDMYLMKTCKEGDTKGVRGACDGLFPFAPKTEKTEIGYWRKAYSLMNKICSVLNADYENMNLTEYKLSKEQLQELKEYCIEQAKITTDEWDKVDFSNGEKYFDEALNLIKDNPSVEIYFMCWY